jgi:protein ImuB
MLWVAIDFPLLPLEALLRGHASSLPTPDSWAVLEARAVLACNSAAREAGVRAGMGLAWARSIAPGLQAKTRDPVLEREALEGAAVWLGRFTPAVSLEPPRGLVAEVAGSLRLFGGARKLLEDLRHGLAELGFAVSIAMGRTPRAALWRAAGGGGRLEDLPVAVACTGEDLEFLRGIGVRSVGDLMRLPRAGLAKRIAPRLLEKLDQASGARPEPRDFHVPPARFSAKLELPADVIEAQAVLFAAQRLLLQLEGFLAARHAGVRRFVLTLLHRHAAPTSVAIGLAGPSRDARHFTNLLRERLGAMSLKDPVEAIRLQAGEFVPLAGYTAGLFGDEHTDAEGWLRLVERLRARLGAQAVHGLAIHPEHRPEQAWRSVEPGAGAAPAPCDTGPRPLWLLDPPRCLAEGDFALLAGPERIESGWWDGAGMRRDYFIARAADHSLVWVYRDTESWFLHGVFA